MGAGEKGTGSTYGRMGSKFDTWPPYKLLWELCIVRTLEWGRVPISFWPRAHFQVHL